MIKKNTFNQLFKSLTQKEIKGFIEENAGQADKSYLTFFKQHVSNVSFERENQSISASYKNITKLRNYTTQKLVAFLTPEPKAISIDSVFIYHTHYIQFYIDRNVAELAVNQLLAFEKKIKKHERFDYVFQLLTFTNQVYELNYISTHTYQKQLLNISAFINAGNAIINLKTQIASEESENIQPNETESSYQSIKILQNIVKLPLHKTDVDQQIQLLVDIVSQFEGNPPLIVGYMLYYLNTIIQLVNLYIQTAQAKKVVLFTKKLAKHTSQLTYYKLEPWYVYFQLVTSRINHNSKEGFKITKQSHHVDFNHWTLDNPETAINLNLSFISACFFENKFKHINDYYPTLYLFSQKKAFKWLAPMIEMIKLLVLFENNALDQCEYKIRSIRRLFKENNCPPWIYNIFIALVKIIELDIVKFPIAGIRIQILKETQTKITADFRETELELFPFHYYLKGLIQKNLANQSNDSAGISLSKTINTL